MLNKQNVVNFFDDVCGDLERFNGKVLVVTHIIPDRPYFLRALNQVANIAAIIPKPKSINKVTIDLIKSTYKIINLDRKDFFHPKKIIDILRDMVVEDKFIIVDMGGYFSSCIDFIYDSLPNQLVGIIEDTENGHQRYGKVENLPVPFISVARSHLKAPEDFLVGQSIVYSADALMRQLNEIMTGKTALVIGYGKIGESISSCLSSRNISVMVFDIDPIKRVRALSHGYQIPDRFRAIVEADLLFCSSGSKSLTHYDFVHLKNGSFIFSATSSDDEFFIEETSHGYQILDVSDSVQMLFKDGKYFYLANNGNAVNFIHGAAVGSFIYLIQAEILMAVSKIQNGDSNVNESIISRDDQRAIASKWIRHFYNSSNEPLEDKTW